jgi:hypothetical protein
MVLVLACQRTAPEKIERHRATLAGDQVALVGSRPFDVPLLVKVQQQSGLSADMALEKLVNTQLLGHWAASEGLALGRRRTVERGLLARVLLEKIQAQVEQPAQPTDAEVFDATQARWIELDRPEAFRVTHFVVMTEKTTEALAQELARRIALAVKGLTNSKDFIEQARAVPANGLKVVAESLSPVTADGRTFQVDASGKPVADIGMFDHDFARAASRLDVVGAQSGIVRTRFGFHVLLLDERIEGYTMPIEERRINLWPDILRHRAQRISEQVLDERRRVTVPQIDRAALEWMGRIKVNQ